MLKTKNIAVVLPCYRVKNQILGVLSRIGPEVNHIFVVDDCCPENSGQMVKDLCKDSRVQVIFHTMNKGVGGATISGIKAAIQSQVDVIVKVDGDGQIDPELIPQIVYPILIGEADYAKGNRFFNMSTFATMPIVRKVGNLGLSFFTKLSSGYWHIFDPTNGFFAIHAGVANLLETEKIDNRYFFESDLLFRLNLSNAVICDIPMFARYGDEASSLVVRKVFFEFFLKNTRNFSKRILYNYFLRDFNAGSMSLVFGAIFSTFGLTFGIIQWYWSVHTGNIATAGTVMLAALPLTIGLTLFLSFLNFDLSQQNRIPLQKRIVKHLS